MSTAGCGRSAWAVLALVLWFGCAGEVRLDAGPTPPPVTDDASVFDGRYLRRYALSLPESRFQHLLEHARQEQYVRAELSVDGETLGEVGVRAKGAAGTLRGCFDGDELVCDKLSLKLRFDKYDPRLRLAGLKRLNLNSMEQDPSLIRDRLSYALFADMGVAAPRSAHAEVFVNGRLLGLYAVVEQVDEAFLESRFSERPDGRLYKEVWPDGRPREAILEGLRAGSDSDERFGIEDLSAALMAAGPDALQRVVDRHFDVDYLARHLAVDDALDNWDGIRRFACWSAACRNHNFYLYEPSDGGPFVFIPWDYDLALPTNRERLEGIPRWTDQGADCSEPYEDAKGRRVMAPGCDPLLRGLSQMERGRLADIYGEIKHGPFEAGEVEARIRGWVDQLAYYVERDPDRTLGAWHRAVDRVLEEYLPAAHDDLSEAIEVLGKRPASPARLSQ